MTDQIHRAAGETAPDSAPPERPEARGEGNGLVIVGVGASAGGLEALRELLGAMPAAPGFALVIIQHLDPTRPSLTAEILQTCTSMTVSEVDDDPSIVANRVYVIPPDKYLGISGGKLHLSEPDRPRGRRAAVDHFLRELAHEQAERAVAVILSGSGSDGSLGIKAIKERGGLVIAQRPETAAQDGMPRSAIATGAVDHVLDAASIPEILVRYARTEYVRSPERLSSTSAAEDEGEVGDEEHSDEDLARILELLRAQSRHDFRCYKEQTLCRRIHRRMSLLRIESLQAYHGHLRAHPEEATRLTGDLLISVTDFFRDAEAWETLKAEVIEPLVRRNGAYDSVRAWVAGCATGEEAYTLAILILETLHEAGKSCPVQVFGSDVDADALEFARAGRYPSSIALDVSSERLQRFFVLEPEGDHHRVSRVLRDSVVFADQDLVADPPFSRLDLVCCRNVLIYLKPEVQEKLVCLFHFALGDGGLLMLGGSETVGRHEDMFETASKRWRIFRRVGPTRHDRVVIPLSGGTLRRSAAFGVTPAGARRGTELEELAQRNLIEQMAPKALLVTRSWQVLHICGDVDNYLMHAPGRPSTNLLELSRPDLRARLRESVHKAFSEERTVTTRMVVRRGERQQRLHLTVRPVRDEANDRRLALVLFDERSRDPEARAPDSRERGAGSRDPVDAVTELDEPGIIRQLEYELSSAHEELQITIEQLEASNEEYKASNEEVMSINEELQSANEELETSKEELQSLNEELTTVNTELSSKLHELDTQHSDLENLVGATDVATLCLDPTLRIRWFTPAVAQVIRIEKSDLGRPISDFAHDFVSSDLVAVAQEVMERSTAREDEVNCADERTYLRRVHLYRTETNGIGGVVITFLDISDRKRSELALKNLNDTLSEQVESLQTIHDISTQLMVEGELDPLLDEILVAAIALTRAEMGVLRLFDVERGMLVLNASRGFDALHLERYREVAADASLISAAAVRHRARVVVPDVKECGLLADRELLGEFERVGVRAMQSTPLVTRRGTVMGVISTCWSEVHEPAERELRMLELLCRQTSDLVERARGEAALRESEGRLRAQTERLLAQERRRDMFLATLGHELRNPLATLHAGLHIEGAEAQSGPASRAALRRQVTKLSAIVNDLLEVTRISHGKLMLSTLPFELDRIAREASDDARASCAEKRIRLDVHAPQPVVAFGDPIRIDQILSNLLSNASKFTPPGGTITIEVGAEGDAAVVRVTDTGCGMTPEVLEVAFEPFSQASTGGGGCGLGLALSRGLAGLHGGSLEASSAGQGQGSEFTLRLPLADAAAPAPMPKVAASPESDLAGLRILVVDDHADTCSMYGRLLERRGASVEVARDGREALAKDASFEPEVVLLDLSLPDMTGYEVAEQIRARGRPVRLIAVTGFGDERTKSRVAENGFDHHLLKPVEIEKLRAVLAELARRG